MEKQSPRSYFFMTQINRAGGPLLVGAGLILLTKKEGAPFLGYFPRSGVVHVHPSQTS